MKFSRVKKLAKASFVHEIIHLSFSFKRRKNDKIGFLSSLNSIICNITMKFFIFFSEQKKVTFHSSLMSDDSFEVFFNFPIRPFTLNLKVSL